MAIGGGGAGQGGAAERPVRACRSTCLHLLLCLHLGLLLPHLGLVAAQLLRPLRLPCRAYALSDSGFVQRQIIWITASSTLAALSAVARPMRSPQPCQSRLEFASRCLAFSA